MNKFRISQNRLNIDEVASDLKVSAITNIATKFILSL